MNIYSTDLVQSYLTAGFLPIPVPFKSKQPTIKEWTNLAITADNADQYFNGQPINIGILTGERSRGLVDIDIDDLDALKFADWFLPESNCSFGRESKPKSHRVYRVTESKSREAFESNSMIIEVRGNKHFTLFPGSVHPSGEPIEFVDPTDFTPTGSSWEELHRAATRIAIATVLYKRWTKGVRHQLTLSVAAALARLGWAVNDVTDLITAVATEAKDDDLQGRMTDVETTFAGYENNRPISGNEGLIELLGEEGEKILKWACGNDQKYPPKIGRAIKPEGTPHVDISTDVGAANAFSATFKDILIYCNDQWYRKRNQVYEAVSPEAVQGLAKTFLQEQCAQYGSWAPMKSCLSRARINATVELSRADFEVDRRLVDRDPELVGCGDGSIVDLRTGTQLVDYSDVFVTRMLGACLDTNAACPTWNMFLSKIFDGDTEIIGFLRRAVGYSLTGSTAEQCLFILNGSGANGKTTLLTVLHHLFANYAATIPMQTLMNTGNSSQQTNDLAYLVGKRFVTASEGEDGQRLAESKIKLMTGGDRISCRQLYKDYFEFDPQFKLWLATNDLPTISGTGEAIWRQIIVIPFDVTIPPEEQDKTLGTRLLKELPGILRWALQGLMEWKQEHLNPPLQVRNAGGAYRKDNDSVGQWIEDACIVDKDRKSYMKELYELLLGMVRPNRLAGNVQCQVGQGIQSSRISKRQRTIKQCSNWNWVARSNEAVTVDEARLIVLPNGLGFRTSSNCTTTLVDPRYQDCGCLHTISTLVEISPNATQVSGGP